MTTRSARLLPLFAVANVVVSLTLRVVHRGPYYPGWEVVGAANGLHLVATTSLPGLLTWYRAHQWDGNLAWNLFGVPVALLPGTLALWWPSEYWPHVVTFALVVATVALLARALELGLGDAWVLLLAWGASSTLLSYSISGFAYVSSGLPYALALWVVLRCQRSVLGTLAGAAATIALAWHVQELGRTVFVVFLAGAALLRGVPWGTRALWIVAGVGQLALALTHHSFNTSNYASMAVPTLSSLPGLVVALLDHTIVRRVPDLPLLVPTAVLAVVLLRDRRWFWATLLAFHGGLLFLLAANTGPLQGVTAVWPRRTLLVSMLSVATVGALYRQRGGRLPVVVLALLLAGCTWQLADTIRWARRPLDDGSGAAFTLPYTQTPIGPDRHLDSVVPFLPVHWYLEMRAQADAGNRLLLVYDLDAYDENATDPAAVPDRLYLHLGPRRFGEQVLLFGERTVRWNELPVRPPGEIDAALDGITNPTAIAGYALSHPRDDMPWPVAETHRRGVARLLAAIEARYEIVWGQETRDVQGRVLRRFTLRPRG